MTPVEEALARLTAFLAEYPQATVLDIMAECDLSDTEAREALVALRETPRKPGRPRTYHEPREEVRARLPLPLIAAIEASGETITAYIERAVRERLERTTPLRT